MRYLKTALLIGTLASVFAIVLNELGVFLLLDAALRESLDLPRALPVRHSLTQMGACVAVAFGIAWTTVDINRASMKIVVAVAAFLQLIAMTWVLKLYGVFFSPFAGSVALLGSFSMAIIYAQTDAGRRKRVLRSILGHRVSKKTFIALLDAPAPLDFNGQMQEATVVVCEIFNHNDLMDRLPPSDYVAMTNRFLSTASEFMVEAGGYLDECDGESLRVVFGTPLNNPRHAADACRAAIELGAQLTALNDEFATQWHQTIDFRIGINSGEMVTAVYGSNRLGTFSLAGEPVEFARQLCSANLIYGSKILLGARTLELAIDEVEVRPIELLRDRENWKRFEIYELLAEKGMLSDEEMARRDSFWKAIIYFREQRWTDALTLFRQLGEQYADDPLVRFYIRRIERLQDGSGSIEFEQSKLLNPL